MWTNVLLLEYNISLPDSELNLSREEFHDNLPAADRYDITPHAGVGAPGPPTSTTYTTPPARPHLLSLLLLLLLQLLLLLPLLNFLLYLLQRFLFLPFYFKLPNLSECVLECQSNFIFHSVIVIMFIKDKTSLFKDDTALVVNILYVHIV